MTRATISWALSCLVLAAGCGDDEGGGDTSGDVTATDTIADSASSDTGAADTATTDSTPADAPDTIAPDTADTIAPDTADTIAPDTADTIVPDSADSGPSDVATSDVIDNTLRLVGAGWSYGECLTGCRGVLTLEGASLDFEIRSVAGVVEHVTQGLLTTEGAAELDTLLTPLEGQALQLTYGCPDCDDGGASSMTFTLADSPFTTTYERGDPPGILVALDTFLAAIMDALGDCQTTMTVVVQGSCGPPPER